MEAFSLLKYWRGGGGGGLGLSDTATSPTPTAATTTTILAAAVTESDNDDDDGPFFDLEFTAPDEVDGSDDGQEEESDGESEFKITLSPSSNDRSDGNLSLSPSEDLFFKGKLVQVDEPSSFVLNNPSEPNSKPQFTSSLLKSATKFRVFMLGLKKPKPDSSLPQQQNKKQQQQRPQRIKFKVEEVPIVSLFTRDNSSKGNNKSEEKRFSKEVVMHKYLKMVKPLYVRVSRRYSHGDSNNKQGSKTAVEEEAVAVTEVEEETVVETTVKTQKQGNIPAGLRVVYKHLGKSRSASSTVAASPPAAVSSKRRDDSLLQQQDGIQGAILHCKRSFNASRESESSQLPRSVSDPLREISPELSRKSNDKRL